MTSRLGGACALACALTATLAASLPAASGTRTLDETSDRSAPVAGAPAALFGQAGGADESRPAPALRGASEELLFQQAVTSSDEGVGPLLLLAISTSCPFQTSAADDFTVDASAYLTRVTWEGLYFGAAPDFPGPDESVRITIYEDDGAGNAGDVVADFAEIDHDKARNPREPIFGTNPVYSFTADLPEPVFLHAGRRYWLAINVNPAGPSGPAFGWMVSPWGNAAETAAADQPLQTQQAPCEALPATTFIPGGPQGLDADLAFALFSGCADDDCDCDGISDAEAIAAGFAADCNGNGVPDSCEIAFGLATDCDGDGVPDECQMDHLINLTTPRAAPLGTGNPQTVMIEDLPPAIDDVLITIRSRGDYSHTNESLLTSINGSSLGFLFKFGADCANPFDVETIEMSAQEFNALASEGTLEFHFQPTLTVDPFLCNQPGWVEIDLHYQFREMQDCNGNGVYDACDIASGASADCNGDGVPDECQLSAEITLSSPIMGPIGAGSPQEFAFTPSLNALGDVALVIEASGDFDSPGEYLDIYVNDDYVGRAFEQNGVVCPVDRDKAHFVLPGAEFNARITGGGSLVVRAEPSVAVAPGKCDGASELLVALKYPAAGAADCNGNGVLDSCEIAAGADSNGNGLPDDCDPAGDLNGDGAVNSMDLSILLGAWGTSNPAADLNGDGVVDAADLATLLSYF